LTISDSVSQKARQHSCDMAKQQTLAHDPHLAPMIDDDPSWTQAGENVGFDSDLYQMHLNWMASPEHRNNILDWHFSRMGVGVCQDSGGTYWATVVFYG